MPAQHIVSTLEMITFRRRNMYKTKKYTLWSNFRFVFTHVWKEKRSYIRDMITGIILSVIVPVIGSMLSALVVGLLGESLSAVTVIAAILSAFVGYALVNATDTYIRQKHVYHHIEVRSQLFMRQFTKKICEIPQEQYEDPELKLLREKACNAVSCNNAGVEGLLRAVSAFGTGVLGLFVYMVIAGSIHPVILLLLFGLSVIGALCNSLPDWYENKIRDENARDEMTMQYIDRLSDDAISGKDIRVFGLKKWIIGKYGNAITNTRRRNAKKNSIAFAGKSTLVKLISGLYLPTEGTIYVNGIDTRKLDREKYYEHEAAVFQDTFTLTYSVAENVALNEQWDEEKVWECLEKAGLSQKVKALPQGLSTNLGKELSQDGVRLSGGETQKLLLARALYRNPSIILLDEPTAALDALAESEIYEIYNRTLADITALFISHRLASTRFCEEILLLSDGRIAECGSHEELMEQKGKYYELFLVQSKYYGEGGAADVD